MLFSQQCVDGDCENGKGTYYTEAGLRYSGDFKNGKFDGSGNLVSPDGKEGYMGDFKEGLFHGKGTFAGNEYKYEGDFEKGQFSGQGKMSFKDGSEYVGGFKENYMSGMGIMSFTDGGSYSGEWKDGMRHGMGKMILSSSTYQKTFDVYEGEFNSDFIQGKGIYTYSYGMILNGIFGRVEGQKWPFDGMLILGKDSVQYTGTMTYGLPDGKGTAKYLNGDSYMGEYKDGLFDGEGVYTYANGTMMDGYFRKGEFILAK